MKNHRIGPPHRNPPPIVVPIAEIAVSPIGTLNLEVLTIENIREVSKDAEMRATFEQLREDLLTSRENVRLVNEKFSMQCRTQIAEYDELRARVDAALNGTTQP